MFILTFLTFLFSMKIRNYITVVIAIKLSLAIILKKKTEMSSYLGDRTSNIPIWTSCHFTVVK